MCRSPIASYDDALSEGHTIEEHNGFEDSLEGDAVPLCDPLEPEMIEVPPGLLTQGDERRPIDGQLRRIVIIETAFAIGKHPVTFEEFDRYANAFDEHVKRTGSADGFPGLLDDWPSRPGDQGWGRGRRPVINVSWHNAKSYVHWLGVMTGKAYRLPAEAEWEYACRAGAETAYASGETISHREAHFSERSPYRSPATQTVEIGNFPSNAFGLNDMHGNVWEWCEDAWADSYAGSPDDGSPRAPIDRHMDRDEIARVLRGGLWRSTPAELASGHRSWEQQGLWRDDIGFRLALTL